MNPSNRHCHVISGSTLFATVVIVLVLLLELLLVLLLVFVLLLASVIWVISVLGAKFAFSKMVGFFAGAIGVLLAGDVFLLRSFMGGS
jgi:hypothetical protein